MMRRHASDSWADGPTAAGLAALVWAGPALAAFGDWISLGVERGRDGGYRGRELRGRNCAERGHVGGANAFGPGC